MLKRILPLALVTSLSACGMFGSNLDKNPEGEITTGGGATNEVLEPVDRTPADWPTDQRPYMKSEPGASSGSGASGTDSQTSGSSAPDAEVIIIEPVQPVPSTSGASGMESSTSGSIGSSATESVTTGASGSEQLEPTERTPAKWPTDQRPYVNEQK